MSNTTSTGFWASVANKWRGFRFVTKEDLHSKEWWFSWLWIAIGTLILSFGFVLFMYPYNLTPGGIWGMATVLNAIFPSIDIGWFGYMMDIPLLLMAFLVFGPVFGIRTVYASLLTPMWMLIRLRPEAFPVWVLPGDSAAVKNFLKPVRNGRWMIPMPCFP